MTRWAAIDRVAIRRGAVPVAAVAVLLAIVWATPWNARGLGGQPGWVAAAPDAIAGLALAAAAALLGLAWWDARAGRFALLAAIAFAARALVASEAVAPAVRAIALVAAPLASVLLVGLAVGVIDPGGRRPRSVAALGVLMAAMAVGRAIAYRPFADLRCVEWCGENPARLVDAGGVAVAVELLLAALSVFAGAWLVAAALARARRPRGAREGWLVVTVVGVGGAVVLDGCVAIGWRAGAIGDARLLGAAQVLLAAASVMIAAAAAIQSLRTAARAHAVRRLVEALTAETAPGGLTALLRIAVAEPELGVVFREPGADVWIDDAGVTVAPLMDGAASGRHVLPVERDGQVVAVIAYDHPGSGPAIAAAMGPTARLLFDNERLRAMLVARLADLQRARADVVDASDAARRRLERDLHDGAQQRLLTAGIELRRAADMARAADPAHAVDPAPSVATPAPATADATIAAAKASAADPTAGALAARIGTIAAGLFADLDELRRIARGVHPASLAASGLAAALEDLADRAPLALQVRHERPDRPGGSGAELIGYRAIVDLVSALGVAGATWMEVDIARIDGWLRLEVRHDAPAAGVPDQVRDRVEARDGRVVLLDPAPDGAPARGELIMELPCA
jgi:signal transduction histidine kinase